jgi:L-asparaginase II
MSAIDGLVPLVETTRAGLRECLHLGSAVLVDTQGQVLQELGDAQQAFFTRSTLKPFQALPLVQSGAAAGLGLDSAQLALLCASHNGEDMHVEQVNRLLASAGASVSDLRCGRHVPYRFTWFNQAMPAGFAHDERHHNCSGKHSGFLAYCLWHRLPLSGYTDPAHPLQQAVLAAVAQVAGLDAAQIRVGIDGCSAPNLALPLAALARCFARLAAPPEDEPHAQALRTLGQAMTRHPELVSGSGRNDAAFMQAGRGDWVCKIGADGLQVLASRARGQALAVKVADGSTPALYAATVALLDQLGWLDAAQQAALAPWRGTPLVNASGQVVGERRVLARWS